MNTDRQASPVNDRDLPRRASAKEIEALQRAVRRAQSRLTSTRPIAQVENSGVQDLRGSLDHEPIES